MPVPQVHLERPLGERTVIDGFGGEPVPFKNVYAEIEAETGASPAAPLSGVRSTHARKRCREWVDPPK